MKKSSKILGSVALSAALCMGTAAPAFAAPTAANVPGDLTDTPVNTRTQNFGDMANDKENGASTVVTVSTYTSQLNVTVPLYLPIYLDTVGTPTNGVSNAIVPTSGQYYIKNSSPVDVTVTNARYVNVNSKIRLGTSTNASGNFTMPQNSYKMELSLKDNATAKTLKLESDSATSAGNNNIYKSEELGWVLPAKPTDGDAIQNTIDIAAYNGSLTQGISNEKLAAIIYTVSVASQAAPGANADGTVSGGGSTFTPGSASAAIILQQASISVADLQTCFSNAGSFFTTDGTTAITLDPAKVYKVKAIERQTAAADEAEGTPATFTPPITSTSSVPAAANIYRVTVEVAGDAPAAPETPSGE